MNDEAEKINKKPLEEALLAEYEACEQDNNASPSVYWTMAGIFIGISSAMLGGLIYGVMANNELFQTLFEVISMKQITTNGDPRQILMLGIIILILGSVIVFILYFLKGWLRRISFLQQINFERMREIELELGMWKSWRVHGIDNWMEIRDRVGDEWLKRSDELGDKCSAKLLDKIVWDELKIRLGTNLNIEYFKRLDEKEGRLVELCKRYLPKKVCKWSKNNPKPEYEPSTRKLHFKWIFRILFALWVLVILAGLGTIAMASVALASDF